MLVAFFLSRKQRQVLNSFKDLQSMYAEHLFILLWHTFVHYSKTEINSFVFLIIFAILSIKPGVQHLNSVILAFPSHNTVSLVSAVGKP